MTTISMTGRNICNTGKYTKKENILLDSRGFETRLWRNI
jgi:hypothetical protein